MYLARKSLGKLFVAINSVDKPSYLLIVYRSASDGKE